MATVEEGLETQIRNIEATYGRSLPEWFALIEASGLTKHPEVVAFLKSEHDMTHGAAHRVSLLHRERGSSTAASDSGDPTTDLYSGRKAALRPLHDELMGAIARLGSDITVVPKKGYLSLRRAKQFAMVQPSTATRIDVGLIIKGRPAGGRLEDAKKFNALFTHRVRISQRSDIDAEFIGWVATAYRAAAG